MQTNLQIPQRLFAQPVRYEIPDFQRRYVWRQDEQWEPLWEDVENLAQSLVDGEDTKRHFMGAIVLQQQPFPAGTIEQRIVVDGQQRLTTLQLLIDAIQEVLESRSHADAAKRLATLVANGEEFRNGKHDHAVKIWPTVFDREAFKHAMSNELSSAAYADSRIVEAHNYFKAQTTRWLELFSSAENADAERKAANSLEEAVRAYLEIVVIDLGDSDDPHIIFETLNARGTPLLQSDMVKNKILHDTGIGLGGYGSDAPQSTNRAWPFDQDEWWAQEVGRGLQRRPRVDVYLNHWLTLRNQSEMKPYYEFAAFAEYAKARSGQGRETKDVIQDIADDLGSLGRIYQEVETHPREVITKFVARRDVMSVGVVTPLLLWLLDADLDEAVVARSIRALESFLVRRVICGYSARSYGRLFVGLIERLAQDETGQIDRALISYLSEQTSQAARWPSDADLLDRFKTAPLYQILTQGRLRMVLEGVEEALRKKKAESDEVPAKLPIEHIMPQTWGATWPLPEDLANDPEAIVNRNRSLHTIGNLTLVNTKLNSALSNAPWENKRKTLADYSVLYLNKRLVDKAPKEWDEAAIEKRAKWLHKQAARIWPQSSDFDG